MNDLSAAFWGQPREPGQTGAAMTHYDPRDAGASHILGQFGGAARRDLASPAFEEQGNKRGAPPSRCDVGYQRLIVPEALMGDHGDCVVYCDDKDRLIPGFSVNVSSDKVELSLIDFTTVGPVGQVRSVLQRLYGGDPHTVARTPGVVAGANYDIVLAGIQPNTAGIRVDVSLPFNNYAPYDLQVQTIGYINTGGQVVDRNITLRVNNALGFSLYLPFALRITPSMNQAMHQIGTSLAAGVTIRLVAPPPAILAAISATSQYLSAFSPLTAAWATGNGIFQGPR
jgi:hypothetical protein